MALPMSRDEDASYTDPFSSYGKAIIQQHHDQLALEYPLRRAILDVTSQAITEGDDLALASDHPGVLLRCPRGTDFARVGIIGAGVGGLYAAMMLQSLDIEYEILEASERVGGRLYTHRFSGKPHDYFDVGAMRFPDTPMMKRTFNLFKKLKEEAGLSVISYVFKNDNSTLSYNNVLMKRGSSTEDPTKWKIPDIPREYAQHGWSALVDNVVNPFLKQLAADCKKGWELLMQYDQYSTRAYMSGNRSDTNEELDALGLMPYPNPVVDWLEMFDRSSAWYDRALSETVLESLAFAYPDTEVAWWCVDGGSQVVADKMVKLLGQRHVRMGARVRAIALRNLDTKIPDPWNHTEVELSFANGAESRSYGHVISTVALPCLRTMDLSQATLTSHHNIALRTLRYGPAVKIGVKFKVSWWTDAELMKKYQQPQFSFGPIVGGQSYTDRMLRTVVYPSYGGARGEKSTVLMVSYCWTEDANRLSALLGDASKEELKDIVLRDLTAIHGFCPTKGYEFLKSQWEDHFAWSWSDQPDFMGAYGFFGPGQFSYIYKHMTQPAALGRLHFAGETLSTRHAWVVGALDASWRAVYEIICTSYPQKLKKFKHLWGSEEDWTDANVLLNVAYSMESQMPRRDGAGVGSQATI